MQNDNSGLHRRRLTALSQTLLDNNNLSELKRALAASNAETVSLPRDSLFQVLSNLPHGAPADLLEDVAKDDSLYVTLNRRALLQLLGGSRRAVSLKREQKPSGRKQDPINHWAIQEIQNGRDPKKVESEYWQKRRERGDDVDFIVDLHDNFKKNVMDKVRQAEKTKK